MPRTRGSLKKHFPSKRPRKNAYSSFMKGMNELAKHLAEEYESNKYMFGYGAYSSDDDSDYGFGFNKYMNYGYNGCINDYEYDSDVSDSYLPDAASLIGGKSGYSNNSSDRNECYGTVRGNIVGVKYYGGTVSILWKHSSYSST